MRHLRQHEGASCKRQGLTTSPKKQQIIQKNNVATSTGLKRARDEPNRFLIHLFDHSDTTFLPCTLKIASHKPKLIRNIPCSSTKWIVFRNEWSCFSCAFVAHLVSWCCILVWHTKSPAACVFVAQRIPSSAKMSSCVFDVNCNVVVNVRSFKCIRFCKNVPGWIHDKKMDD